MSIRPIDVNGMIQNTQELGHGKHQADQKVASDQQNMQMITDQKVQEAKEQVVQTEKSPGEYAFDAKNGNGKGDGNSRKKNKKEEQETKGAGDGKVQIKGHPGGFDVSI